MAVEESLLSWQHPARPLLQPASEELADRGVDLVEDLPRCILRRHSIVVAVGTMTGRRHSAAASNSRAQEEEEAARLSHLAAARFEVESDDLLNITFTVSHQWVSGVVPYVPRLAIHHFE